MRLDALGPSTTLASTKSQALTQRRVLLTQHQELLADCSVLRLARAVCFDALIARLRPIGIGSAAGLREMAYAHQSALLGAERQGPPASGWRNCRVPRDWRHAKGRRVCPGSMC